jgi:hypothetical protein
LAKILQRIPTTTFSPPSSGPKGRSQQRIGRLDRYGQRHVLKVFNLRVPDSSDDRTSLHILAVIVVDRAAKLNPRRS